jgi:hypothetical protein
MALVQNFVAPFFALFGYSSMVGEVLSFQEQQLGFTP